MLAGQRVSGPAACPPPATHCGPPAPCWVAGVPEAQQDGQGQQQGPQREAVPHRVHHLEAAVHLGHLLLQIAVAGQSGLRPPRQTPAGPRHARRRLPGPRSRRLPAGTGRRFATAVPGALVPTAHRARTSCRRNGAALGSGAGSGQRSAPGRAPGPTLRCPLQLPLWYQGRYQGQGMLAVVLGGVSGQQEYLSKVLLQTSSAEAGRGAPQQCPDGPQPPLKSPRAIVLCSPAQPPPSP